MKIKKKKVKKMHSMHLMEKNLKLTRAKYILKLIL